MTKLKHDATIILAAYLVSIVFLGGMSNTHAQLPDLAFIGTFVSQDAFVGQNYPDTSFGHYNWLSIGNDTVTGNWTEIYVCFNLTDRPDHWTDAIFMFNTDGRAANVTGYLQEVSTDWSEDTITWNNRPALLSYSEQQNYTEPLRKWFNLTTFLHRYDSSGANTNISFLWNATLVNDGNYTTFSSRESGYAPYLIWYYEAEEPGFDWTPVIIAAVVIGAGVAAVAILLKRRGKGTAAKPKTAKKPTKPATAPGAKSDGPEDLDFSV